jgi:nucleotide-binding universal stress UspA family protein
MIPNDPAVDAMFLASRDQLAQALVQAVENIAAAVGVASDTVREECDSPHEGIIDAATARGCDLIFMASHGRRGMSALLLGSETQKVLTHCRIPVLVYR